MTQPQQQPVVTQTSDAAFRRELRAATLAPAFGVSGLAILLLGLIGYLLYTMRSLDQAQVVIAQVLEIERRMLDIQRATRGFYLTGDPAYIEPYTASRNDVLDQVDTLRGMLIDEPIQLNRVDRVKINAAYWLDGATDALFQANQPRNEPIDIVETLAEEKERFDQVQQDIDGLIRDERKRRNERATEAGRAVWAVIASAVASALALGAAQAFGVRKRLTRAVGAFRGALELAEWRQGQLQRVLKELDVELRAVGEIQRSLLPIQLPKIPGLHVAASYQTSRRAGGDYYDFFKLPPPPGEPEEAFRYGILIADVSGHGTPAAVLMAVTHSIAHGYEHPGQPPSDLLGFVNRRLCESYTSGIPLFVTAFYAIYDPRRGTLTYSSAGHHPPRLCKAGRASFDPIATTQRMPLGLESDEQYIDGSMTLGEGDTLVLYTDGIVEARDKQDEMFGVARLDAAVASYVDNEPERMVQSALEAVTAHAGPIPDDDRTLLVLHVRDDPAAVGSRRALIAPSPSPVPTDEGAPLLTSL